MLKTRTALHSVGMIWAARIAFLCLLFLLGCAGGARSNITTTQTGTPSISSLSPTSGVIGASVVISGSNFGATKGPNTVTFNGLAASVAQWSNSAIAAKVPSGATSGNVIVTVGGTASNAVSFNVVTPTSGAIALGNFGFQCGLSSNNCPGATLPTGLVLPGLLRLHDAGTAWGILSTGSGTYDWTNLDGWLDTVAAQNPPPDVIQVFSWVPCWTAPALACGISNVVPNGTNGPPADLNASGSASFNAFVTAFTTHCSAAGNCVNKFIKYYEMWNEWDAFDVSSGLRFRWGGTMNQLYQMLAPAVSIIRSNVSGAVILAPSTFTGGKLFGNPPADLTAWLNNETTAPNVRISDWVTWHDYLAGATPEQEWAAEGANFLSAQLSLPAWASAPWADTETNFDTRTFACASTYSAKDCTGHIIRWQLLHASNGASSLDWYKWTQTIGANSQYEAAYSAMMQFLVGGTFSGPCAQASPGATTWTCAFKELSGTSAVIVWDTSGASGLTFTVPSGTIDYIDLSTGAKTNVSGTTAPISTVPIMLEQ